MFSWLNKQGIRSSEGFEVQRTGRFTMEYREGLRYLTLDVEASAYGAIDFDSTQFEKWNNSSIRNSPDEQKRMLANFKAALNFLDSNDCP